MKNFIMQDYFLNQARKEKVQLTVFLTNGYQFSGLVKGFDNFTVNLLDTDGRQNIVYKHAISTIRPARVIQLIDQKDETDDEGESK